MQDGLTKIHHVQLFLNTGSFLSQKIYAMFLQPIPPTLSIKKFNLYSLHKDKSLKD